VSALLRIQKPPIVYLEKSLHEILYHMNRPCTNDECCCPGDRDDNLWITINDYKPPGTQAEWEQICFLDKCFHGYYKWPRIIKYPMNKRQRYTKDAMPEHVAIIYARFMDKQFVAQLLQYMIVDEDGDEINFDIHRFRMFKVNRVLLNRIDVRHANLGLSRVCFEISAWILLIISWCNCIN
jgi:hypothetical protein